MQVFEKLDHFYTVVAVKIFKTRFLIKKIRLQ